MNLLTKINQYENKKNLSEHDYYNSHDGFSNIADEQL